MIKRLIFIAFFFSNAHAIELFKADYEVYQNGKKSAISSTELKYDGAAYVLIDQTHGTHGMASFLGFKRQESTWFTIKENGFSPYAYDLNQKVAFKKRQSTFSVDSLTNTVIGKYKGKQWEITAPDTFLTTNLVLLQLAHDICAGKTTNLSYPIIKDGKLKNYRFVITEEVNDIVEIDRVHNKSSRVTKTWLDKERNCLSIKTYHHEDGQDPIETKLIAINDL